MNRYYLQTVRHLLAATHHFVKKECVRLVQIRAHGLADRARRGDGRLTRSFMHGPVFGHHHAVRVSVGRATTLPSSCPQTMQKLHSKASDHTHQAHTHTHTTEKACHLSTAHQPPYSRAFNHDAIGMDATGPPCHPRLITQTFNPGQTNATQTGTKTVI